MLGLPSPSLLLNAGLLMGAKLTDSTSLRTSV